MLTVLISLAVQVTQAAPADQRPALTVSVRPTNPTVVVGDSLRLAGEVRDANGRRCRPRASAGWADRSRAASTRPGLVHSGRRRDVRRLRRAERRRKASPADADQRADSRAAGGHAWSSTTARRSSWWVSGWRWTPTSSSSSGDRRRDADHVDRPPRRPSRPCLRFRSSDSGGSRIGDDSRHRGQRSRRGRSRGRREQRSAESRSPAACPRRGSGDVLRFKAVARDAAGKEIAGLTPTWTMAPGSGLIETDGAFVANEPGQYTISASFGSASGDATVRVRARDVRRVATKVGRVPLAKQLTAEFWPHPNGKNAYLSTIGDRIYALDISNPASPTITDSVIVDARVDQRRDDDGRREIRGGDAGKCVEPAERHRRCCRSRTRRTRSSSPSTPRRCRAACTRRSCTRSRSSGRTSISRMMRRGRCA